MVAIAKGSADLHPLLATKHVFGERVAVGALDKDGRRDVSLINPRSHRQGDGDSQKAPQVLAHLIQTKVDSSPLSLDSEKPLNFTSLSTQTEGFSVSDLRDFVGRAVQEAVARSLKGAGSSETEVRRHYHPLRHLLDLF